MARQIRNDRPWPPGHRVGGPARAFARDMNVVVVAATTEECRRCGNDDKCTREGSVPRATAAAAVTAVTWVLASLLDDHGTTAPGEKIKIRKLRSRRPRRPPGHRVDHRPVADHSRACASRLAARRQAQQRPTVWPGQLSPATRHGDEESAPAQGGPPTRPRRPVAGTRRDRLAHRHQPRRTKGTPCGRTVSPGGRWPCAA
jgi:hypothetical protein